MCVWKGAYYVCICEREREREREYISRGSEVRFKKKRGIHFGRKMTKVIFFFFKYLKDLHIDNDFSQLFKNQFLFISFTIPIINLFFSINFLSLSLSLSLSHTHTHTHTIYLSIYLSITHIHTNQHRKFLNSFQSFILFTPHSKTLFHAHVFL